MNEISFAEYGRYILKELERLNQNFIELDTKMQKIHVDLVMLKTKASVWGGIAGIVPSVIMFIVQQYTK